MKSGIFISEISRDFTVNIPLELRERLKLEPGDKIEVSIKKIHSRRLDILLSQNPLYQLLHFSRKE